VAEFRRNATKKSVEEKSTDAKITLWYSLNVCFVNVLFRQFVCRLQNYASDAVHYIHDAIINHDTW